MPNRKVALLCACAGAALGLPTAASAQIDPGVNYDPGSPAGKEYAIPLAEGRSDAAGTTNQRKGANIPFGVGIKPPGAKGGGTRGDGGGTQGDADSAGGRSGGKSSGQAGGAGRGPQGGRPGESSEQLAARIARAEQPQGTAGGTFLLALAVLGPAALLTLLLWPRTQVSRTGKTA